MDSVKRTSFADMPDEIVGLVAAHLAGTFPHALFTLSAVNRRFRRIVREPEAPHWTAALGVYAELWPEYHLASCGPLSAMSSVEVFHARLRSVHANYTADGRSSSLRLTRALTFTVQMRMSRLFSQSHEK